MKVHAVIFCILLCFCSAASCQVEDVLVYRTVDLLIYNYTDSQADITAVHWFDDQKEGEDILPSSIDLAPGTFFYTTVRLPQNSIRFFTVDVSDGTTISQLTAGFGAAALDLFMAYPEPQELTLGFRISLDGTELVIDRMYQQEGLNEDTASSIGVVEL